MYDVIYAKNITFIRMKILCCYIFTIISLTAFCQNDTVFIRYNNSNDEKKISYKTDTILFASQMQRKIIYGTMALPGSIGQHNAMNAGLFLKGMTGTDCLNVLGEEPAENDKITDIRQTDSTLEIETKIAAPCCISFLGDVDIVDDSILHVNYSLYGVDCSCPCCYGLTYKFEIGRDYIDLRSKIKWVEINNEEKTMKSIRLPKDKQSKTQ
jgi:hypothetical protein